MVENKETLAKPNMRKRKAEWESNGGEVTDNVANGVNFEKQAKKQRKEKEDELHLKIDDSTRIKPGEFEPKTTKSLQPLKPLTAPSFSESILQMRDYLLPKNISGEPILYTKDIQQLVLYVTQGIVASEKPRWCSVSNRQHLSSVFVAVVESASVKDTKDHKELVPFLTGSFKHKAEVISPSQYSGCSLEELLLVENGGSPHPVTSRKTAAVSFKVNRISDPSLTVADINWRHPSFKTTKLDLMLTSEEMKMEGYSLPFENNSKTQDFKYSRKSYKMPTKNSPMFAIDCEMISTTAGRELASICVVDEKLDCIYSTLVKPTNQVLDYNTRFSGITEEMLKNVETKLSDVQKHLRNILPEDVIIVGQSLNFDLDALKVSLGSEIVQTTQHIQLYHPFVIDTSSIFNLSGYRDRKSKLQLLTKLFLRREIQNGSSGHSAREDADASMRLVLLKLNKGYRYGNVLQGWIVDELEEPNIQSPTSSIHQCNEDGKKFKKEKRKSVFFRPTSNYENIFQLAANVGRTSTLLGSEDTSSTSGESDSRTRDSRTLKKCREVISSGESYLTIAHLHEVKEAIDGDECSIPGNSQSQSQPCSKCFMRSLKDTDRRLKKVYNMLPPRCLVVVLFTGRTNGPSEHQDGLCFVDIKPKSPDIMLPRVPVKSTVTIKILHAF